MHHTTPRSDPAEIVRALRLIMARDQVTEVRALEAVTAADRRPHVESGYYDGEHVEQLADAVGTIRSAKGVYVTPNPVNPALLARASNRLKAAGRTALTGDKDIVARRWLLVDIDPQRPADISSSDEEHDAAVAMANKIKSDLSDGGWPEPIQADSGNGAHLLYRIDQPAEDDGLVERCLKSLAAKYDTDALKVDTGVYNPARIWKLYGTLASKGDHTPDRPHRMSKIIHAPESIDVVSCELLEALAGQSPSAPEPKATTSSTPTNGRFNLDEWITSHNLDLRGPEPWQGGRRWVFSVCPWNTDHTNGSAFILQQASGAIAAGCHHDSCRGRDWHALRDIVEPGWRERRSQPASAKHAPPLPWQPFPVPALPEPIRQYVASSAEAIGCDPSYVALPLLAALASAIGNTRRALVKSSWREPPVIWAAIIGESGTMKTPALRAATTILKTKQAEALRAHAEAMEHYDRELLTYGADAKAWQQKGRKAGEPPPEKPAEPIAQRYLVGDVTIEALADRLQHAPRGLLVATDELSSWLNGFSQYKGGKGSDTGHWLSLFGAEMLLVDRKAAAQKTICIPRAAVCVTGGVQPETLRHALGREHFVNGLAARLLVVMPPRRAKRWSETSTNPYAEVALANVFGELLALEFDRDHEVPTPIDVPLSPEAKALFVQFHDAHAVEQATLTGDLAAAWSKLECYAPRLALVDHCIRVAGGSEATTIQRVSMEGAITLARWFAHEVQRVYAILAESDDAREDRQLVELIGRKGGRITPRELQQASRQYATSEAAEAALEALAKAGIGRWAAADPPARGGHAPRVFILSTVSTVYARPLKPGKNGASVDVDSVDTPNIDLEAVNAMLAEVADEEVMEWTA